MLIKPQLEPHVGHKYPVNYKINFIQNDEAGLLNFGLFCVIFLVVKGIIRILSHLIRYQLSWGGFILAGSLSLY